MSRAWMLGLTSIVASLVAGCATAERQPLITAGEPQDRLFKIATDPMRPLPDRLAGARDLDVNGRRKLETELLADLPELWGLEWRERLSLLGAVGSETTVQALQDLNARGELPGSARAQAAMKRTIRSIQSRLGDRPPPATSGS